jgi:hypothetical protein
MITRNVCLAGLVAIALLPPRASAAPQAGTASLTTADRAEIQELVAGYVRALGACAAEAYADLFVPGSGYFASNIRGEVTGRDRLIALVRSERHCVPAATPAPANAAAQPPRANNVPTVVLEVTATGVTGRADLGNAGSYADEYVQTRDGWRFKSRTVISRQEQAANLTAGDFVAIRRLAGTDLGLFDDVYVPGADGVKRFRSSGVALGLSSEGVTGRAVLKGDGGRYDDVYVRTANGGWRFKSRIYVPEGSGAPAAPAGSAAR